MGDCIGCGGQTSYTCSNCGEYLCAGCESEYGDWLCEVCAPIEVGQ